MSNTAEWTIWFVSMAIFMVALMSIGVAGATGHLHRPHLHAPHLTHRRERR